MLPSYIVNYFWPENHYRESEEENDALLNSDPYNIITTHLYLGSIESLKDSSKFTLIVNCTKTIEFPEKTLSNQIFLRIPINDDPTENENLLAIYDRNQVLEKIHYCRVTFRQVLVHCHAGMQRSWCDSCMLFNEIL
jgi:predicted protein tyrosine phosphatase